jgi:hypothetical protein
MLQEHNALNQQKIQYEQIFTVQQLLYADITVQQLLYADITVQQLLYANITVQQPLYADIKQNSKALHLPCISDDSRNK